MAKKKQKPRRAPGPAKIGDPRGHDFTLTAAMYYDAIWFHETARACGRRGDTHGKERFLRAGLLTAFGFFEATLNQIAWSHVRDHGRRMDPPIRDVLEEKETAVDQKGYIERRSRYYPLEQRLSVLTLYLTGQEFPRSGQVWSDFQKVKRLRDKWTHPKPPFKPWSLRYKDVRDTVEALRAVLQKLSQMLGDSSPTWCPPWDVVVAQFRGDDSKFWKWVLTENRPPSA